MMLQDLDLQERGESRRGGIKARVDDGEIRETGHDAATHLTDEKLESDDLRSDVGARKSSIYSEDIVVWLMEGREID